MDEPAATADDIGQDDTTDSPSGLSKSQPWLSLLTASKKAFAEYNSTCDKIDKLYASLARLGTTSREREFQLFWANIQVLGPSIYSRPPVPVVVPYFKDRRPIARTTAEVLERMAIVTMATQDLNGVLLGVRDDLTTISRGQVWLQLETKDNQDYVTVNHLDRRDYLCDPARNEKEIDWKAKCAWMTKAEARKRFNKTSGNLYQNASYMKAKSRNTSYAETEDKTLKAPIWELWCKSANKVVWIAEGCETVLDEGPPHLALEGFFPCPKPAVGTVERGTVVPVPDIAFYKDQLEEINEFTGRLAALAEGLKVRGFYPAGSATITDAIEAAMASTSNNTVLIPISNWAALGGGAAKDMVLWWPIEQVAEVVKGLIELRKQLIDDVYQITGLSDIMRGSTVASETLGAQKLKSQYGSVRIRDRQDEMTRMARDIIRIACEIIAENYPAAVINKLSQMELPTAAAVAVQAQSLQADLAKIQAMAKLAQDPAMQQKIQQNPDMAKEAMAQVQQQSQAIQSQLDQLQKVVTLDQVMAFLRDNGMRIFELDIETDSTIQPDEDAAKQRATEYITAMSALFQQAIPAVQEVPQMAPLLADIINFANSQFRVGRQMATTVEEFTDQMKQMAGQPKPDPHAAQQSLDQAKLAHDQMVAQSKQASDAQQAQTAAAENARKQQFDAEANARKAQYDAQKAQNDHDKAVAETHLEMHRLTIEQQTAKDALDAELKKAEMANLTAIEVARINHASAMEKLALEAKLEADLGLQQHGQAMQLANVNNKASAKIASMKGGPETPAGPLDAPDDTGEPIDGPHQPTPQELLQAQLEQHHQAQQATTSALMQTLNHLHKTMAAPQQVTTPDGRTFTSQRIIN